MRVLVVGAGGVGAAIASIASRRTFFESLTIADVDANRAARAAARTGDERVTGTRVDATDTLDIVELANLCRADVIVNACDPRFNPSLFDAAFATGCDYIDMAMHMSVPDPEQPYERCGVKLGDAQFAVSDALERARPARARRHGCRTRPVRRVRPLRRRPPLLPHRRDRRARRLEPPDPRRPVRAHLLHLDDDRGVPQPAGDLGARARLVHDRAVQRARGVRLPGRHRTAHVRQRRARGSDPHAAMARRRSGHVQVRARRRVHRRADDAAQARARQHAAGHGAGRRGQPARRRGGVPAEPGRAG